MKLNMIRHRMARLGRRVTARINPRFRIPIVLVVYSLGLTVSLWLSYQLRFDFSMPAPDQQQLWHVGSWLIPLKLVLLLSIGQFAGLLSYFSIPDLRRIFLALITASLIAAGVWILTHGQFAPPRSVILGDLCLSFLTVALIRLLFRLWRERFLVSPSAPSQRVCRVGIVGAGDAGAALARELFVKSRAGLRPVVFFDDDPVKWKRSIHDIPVVGPPESLISEGRAHLIDKVIIAMPAAPGKRIREVVDILHKTNLQFETVPSLQQLATGQVKVSQIRPVDIEDLLGRDPVELETQNIRQILEGRVVMVTGAGGSIGSELCRQIAAYKPSRLLLVERSEVQMFQVEQDMIRRGHSQLILPLMADVLDLPRMHVIFERHKPEVVFHAAAHKHVPMMEKEPGEAIKNNTLGTARMAILSREFGVRRFVLISTDKAINPTNVMGATKRLAEIFVQSLAAADPSDSMGFDDPQVMEFGFANQVCRYRETPTKFMAVRFGNVLGSSGSVVPTFKAQIAAGGPVTVTHPEVTRYFMTIPEAVGLVLQSAAQGRGGEIFVLDMGKPVKIADLARQLIELSGLKVGEDIELRFVGLRPGEKLYEELSYASENTAPTTHPKILRFISRPVPFHVIKRYLRVLSEGLHTVGPDDLKLQLKSFLPEYRPQLAKAAPAETKGKPDPSLIEKKAVEPMTPSQADALATK